MNAADSDGPGEWGVVNNSMYERDAIYQQQITGKPAGLAYQVGGVDFDGYADGTLQEVKGFYAQFTENGGFKTWFQSTGARGLVAQAERQLAVSAGVPITWSVAEEPAAAAIQGLFEEDGITGITVQYAPWTMGGGV